jgi:hypothetical protein
LRKNSVQTTSNTKKGDETDGANHGSALSSIQPTVND